MLSSQCALLNCSGAMIPDWKTARLDEQTPKYRHSSNNTIAYFLFAKILISQWMQMVSD